jgi:hypothetical protein
MKKIAMFFSALAVCFFLTSDSIPVKAQDASHPATAQDNDGSDWGLLGLLGLLGLVGLKKKDRADEVDIDQNSPTTTGIR